MPPLIESLQTSPAGPLLRDVVSRASALTWKRRGCPAPAPPHVKRSIVATYAQRFQLTCFVETGTYRGDTLAAVRGLVRRSYSIELDPRLAELARRRFAKHSDVQILEGDSATALPALVDSLREPTLFWLDGHFSDGVTAMADTVTPIESELSTVLREDRPAHVVLVDDVRLFDGSGGYPRLEQIQRLISELRPSWVQEIEADILRVHEPRR